jgi:hypothetical protein
MTVETYIYLTQSTAGISTLGAHQTVFGDRINSSYCLANINAVCREAEEKGLKVNRQVYSKSFSSPAEKTLFTTLNKMIPRKDTPP